MMSTNTNAIQVRRLPGPYSVAALAALCWLAYFSIYLGRLNFSASISDMVDSGAFHKAELGSVAAAFFLSYGVGQLLSGLLGDRYPPHWLVALGLLSTALVNLVFPIATDIWQMRLLWFINGLAQAFIWAPMVRLLADRTMGEQCVRIVLLMSSTGPAGMLCAYGFSAVMIRTYGWKYCFWSPGIWLLAVALLWVWGVGALLRLAERQGSAGDAATRQKATPSTARTHFAAPWFWWLAAAALVHGVLKDGLTTWIPTYLSESFLLSPSVSIGLTMVLPVVNLSGVYLAGWGNRRLFNNEVKTAMFFFGLTLVSILVMILFAGQSLYGTVVLFAVVTSAMTAVNTLFISLVPIHFQRTGAVSTVSGFLNAATYLGSATASMLFGYAAEQFGWPGTRSLWCAVAVAGVVCCAAAAKRWGAARQDIYQKESFQDKEVLP